VVGCVVVGASVGLANLRSLGGPGPNEVTSGGPPTGASVRPCTSAELNATASFEGAAGSVVGTVRVTDTGGRSCSLTGRPDLTIVDPDGHTVAMQVVDAEPGWRLNGEPAPQGWPVVLLRPGSAAEVRIGWSNACPQLTGPVSWTLGLRGDAGTVVATGADGVLVPPCNGPTEPSTLQIGPFEPAQRSANGSG
jgi:hypothetical protein